MKAIKLLLFVFVLPLLSFTTLHKYYVSVSEIEYVKSKQSVQIISRYFIDDFEKVLRERYDESLTLDVKNENNEVDFYIKKYLNQKFTIAINNQLVQYKFIGKEYDNDIMLCYLEIVNIPEINSIEVTNQALQDIFPDQKNVIKLKVNNKNKSFLLNKENSKGVLKF